jgi:hypothetical protein
MLQTLWLITMMPWPVIPKENIKDYGLSFELTLQDVLYIPKLMVNKLAISRKGFNYPVRDRSLLYKLDQINVFQQNFQHGSSQLLGIEFHSNPNHIAATAQTLDINKLRTMLGHPNSQVWQHGFLNKTFPNFVS